MRRLLGAVPRGALVVDAPCGIGPHIPGLQALGARVLALDLSPHMLAHAQADARPALALQADVRHLPLQSDAADSIIQIRLWRYLKTPAERLAVLREARRVARRRVVISFLHPISYAALVRANPTRDTISLTTLRAEAAQAGLRVVKLRPLAPFVKRMWFAAFERV